MKALINNHTLFSKWVISSLLLFSLIGCTKNLPNIEGHSPLSNWVKQGYAINQQTIKPYVDKTVRLWGYLDSHNISLKPNTINNQPVDWELAKADKPSGFMLKAQLNDKAGEAISVHITGNIGQFRQVFEQIRDAGESPQMPILVTGTLRAFDAPTNFQTLTSLMIEVQSPTHIKLRSH